MMRKAVAKWWFSNTDESLYKSASGDTVLIWARVKSRLKNKPKPTPNWSAPHQKAIGAPRVVRVVDGSGDQRAKDLQPEN
jgi:hypothetical protein